jgi:ABC-2 type transport system ATP-binding protein
MAAKTKIIEVKNLTKRYKKSETKAVDDISFYVEKGAFFSLLGPNGAGKTTTMSILTTTLTKTSGQVNIAGFNLDTDQDKIRQEIGVIFQNPSLDLNLTGEENIRFHANLYNLYPYRPNFALMTAKYQNKVTKLAKILDLEKDIFKPVKSFSGGMKRKLEIVRSLLHQPKILFLDEPTTGLDPISRHNLWQYLKQIRKKYKTTIFLTTHYLEEAEDADYICIINNGKIEAKGTPNEIKNSLIEKYILADSEERVKLANELGKHKIKFTGTGPFRIDIEKSSQAQKIIQSIKTPLSQLTIHNPTLEQAYIKIIGNSK